MRRDLRRLLPQLSLKLLCRMRRLLSTVRAPLIDTRFRPRSPQFTDECRNERSSYQAKGSALEQDLALTSILASNAKHDTERFLDCVTLEKLFPVCHKVKGCPSCSSLRGPSHVERNLACGLVHRPLNESAISDGDRRIAAKLQRRVVLHEFCQSMKVGFDMRRCSVVSGRANSDD